MASRFTNLGLCPANVNDCEPKCRTSGGDLAGTYYDCDNPCGCFPFATYEPTIQQCRTNCNGFGGNGSGDCTGNLQIQYGVKRIFHLTGDIDGLKAGTVFFQGGPEGPCNCNYYDVCYNRYDEVLAQAGTVGTAAAATSGNIFNFTVGINDPLPDCTWFEYFGSSGNVLGGTRTSAPTGSGTVVYRWYPYINYEGTLYCSGCTDIANNLSSCAISFQVSCGGANCACCCGCKPCYYNNFGELSCTGGPQAFGNWGNNSGGAVMDTMVVILYKWTSGPLADDKWYTHINSGGWSDTALAVLE